MGDAPVEVACPELVAVVATAMASSTRDVRSSKCLIHNRCASTQGHNKGGDCCEIPWRAVPYTYFCIVIFTSFAHYLKLLPCEGEVARSAETEGLLRLFESGREKLLRLGREPFRLGRPSHLPLVREGADSR